ncbi:hypothetical protein P3W45_000798 [Vairimorpha bombi]|jgi:hypothetical protein
MDATSKDIGPSWSEISPEFKKWRDDSLKTIKNICKMFEETKLGKNRDFANFLKKFPRCMVQFTREMCKCNQYCVADSFLSIKIDYICHGLKTDDLFLSQKHFICNDYAKRVSDGKMFKYNDFHSDFSLTFRIEHALAKLCDDDEQEYYNHLKCAIYELKEECENDPYCFKTFIQPTLEKDCRNRYYIDQIKDIEESVGLNELNLKIVDFGNISGISRNTRSLKNIYENQHTLFERESSLSLNTVECEDNYTVFAPFGYLIGFTILFALVYPAYKLFRKLSSKRATILVRTSDEKV